MVKPSLIPVILFILTFESLTCKVYAQTRHWQWAKSAGGTDIDWGNAVATDSKGNVIVVGNFRSASISFDNYTLTNDYSGGGVTDIFIVKYDSAGKVLWAQSAGGVSGDGANEVCVDVSDNIYVGGWFWSPTITFGSTTLNNQSNNNSDVFIVKYNPSGNVLWAQSIDGQDWLDSFSVTTDKSGNSYIAGSYANQPIIAGSFVLTNAGSNDMFIAKYSPSGKVLWLKGAGGADEDRAYSVSADTLGNIYVGGYFKSSSITFGAFTLIAKNPGSGNVNMFIVKYDNQGNVLWAKNTFTGGDQVNYNNHEWQHWVGVKATTSGNIYVAGFFASPEISFDSTNLINHGPGNNDIYLVKYDNAGNVIWAKDDGGSNDNYVNSIFVDNYDNIYLTGDFNSPAVIFGQDSLTNGGGFDIFVVKIDKYGNTIWNKSAKGANDNYSSSVCADKNDNIYVTGFYYSSTFDFDSTILYNNYTNPNIFIAKLASSGYEINGRVEYDNLTSTPLRNVNIILENLQNEIITSVKTDSNGFYRFANFVNGKYKIIATSDNAVININPTDALLVNRHFINLYKFGDALMKNAADVNLDGKINPSDALLINRFYIKVISAFKAGKWLFESPTITINSANFTQNIKGICVGDVNGN